MGASGGLSSDHDVAMNVLAWFLNVSSSVAIVFTNKVLMDPKGNYAFTFACTLSAIHFLTAAACMRVQQMFRSSEESNAHLPWKDTLMFATVAVVSIASLNLSLLVNPVGLYQVAKLLIIPFVCAIEAVWLGRHFSTATVLCIATVVVGVAIVTVNDLGSGITKLFGVLIAAVSVVSSGMQQILCGTMQRAHKLQSHQLLAATAPVQGAILLVMGPWVDKEVSGNWITHYPVTTGALFVFSLSCSISVLVNLSQFMCLGRFSAVTFQVLGHTKTILVLLISWLVLGEPMSGRKLMGMAIAVAGMIAYSYCVTLTTSAQQSASKPAQPSSTGLQVVDAAEPDAMEQGIRDAREGKAASQKKVPDQVEADVPLLQKNSNHS